MHSFSVISAVSVSTDTAFTTHKSAIHHWLLLLLLLLLPHCHWHITDCKEVHYCPGVRVTQTKMWKNSSVAKIDRN